MEMAKQRMATLRSATLPPSQEELLASVALDLQAVTQHRQNPLGEFKPRGGQQVLEELRAVNGLVTAKASRRRPRRSAGGCRSRPRRPPTPTRSGFMGWGRAGARRGIADADQVRAALEMA
jgi:hypothetical protein